VMISPPKAAIAAFFSGELPSGTTMMTGMLFLVAASAI